VVDHGSGALNEINKPNTCNDQPRPATELDIGHAVEDEGWENGAMKKG